MSQKGVEVKGGGCQDQSCRNCRNRQSRQKQSGCLFVVSFVGQAELRRATCFQNRHNHQSGHEGYPSNPNSTPEGENSALVIGSKWRVILRQNSVSKGILKLQNLPPLLISQALSPRSSSRRGHRRTKNISRNANIDPHQFFLGDFRGQKRVPRSQFLDQKRFTICPKTITLQHLIFGQ